MAMVLELEVLTYNDLYSRKSCTRESTTSSRCGMLTKYHPYLIHLMLGSPLSLKGFYPGIFLYHNKCFVRRGSYNSMAVGMLLCHAVTHMPPELLNDGILSKVCSPNKALPAHVCDLICHIYLHLTAGTITQLFLQSAMPVNIACTSRSTFVIR